LTSSAASEGRWKNTDFPSRALRLAAQATIGCAMHN